MPEMTYAEAIRSGLREEMLRDERVFLIGEDIGRTGRAPAERVVHDIFLEHGKIYTGLLYD